MSEKDEIAKLKAELATKDAALAKVRAEMDRHLGKSNAEAKAESAAIRAELKKKTKKEGDHALYFIPEGGELFYRQGQTFLPGQVVRLPMSEDPSVNWLPVEDAPAATPVAPVHEKKHRASDRDIA